MTNWKTSLFGSIFATSGALAQSGAGGAKVSSIASIVAAISGTLFSLFSKDSNVTGGTVLAAGAAANTPIGR